MHILKLFATTGIRAPTVNLKLRFAMTYLARTFKLQVGKRKGVLLSGGGAEELGAFVTARTFEKLL